MALNSR
ncbi:uncharacterized protein FFMR_12696 [Fusarium fujikuroi]|nr:uncharacterized protein FFMR_12696 [Fusarium fujikuroi]